MPPLYKFDDYDDCQASFGEKAVYCVANIYIQPNKSSQLWNYIEDISREKIIHFRHDILKWGVCVNHCEVPDENFYVNSFDVEGAHPNLLPQSSPEFAFNPDLDRQLNICVNRQISQYGLRSFTDITFCMTQANRNASYSKSLSFRS